ncbi:HHR056Wp [Eremothecium sinecaudum]|uniref:HHR056Wp n=1 Tax=Eremothecium sinecaudum TaxID=45286 RepID=A0A0X8HWM4_9SACH|nr:HHR056Wp [Eremothecium sinecaudum]AMD22825.1 HHR056Wp [Eremothecium sinecaudum]
MNQVAWPDDAKIIAFKPPRVVDQISSLCYNAGVLASLLYLLTSTVVRPLLQRTYKQRMELSYNTLLRLRKLVRNLSGRVKTPISVIGFNERSVQIRKEGTKYVDRCTQTSGDGMDYDYMRDKENESRNTTWMMINNQLERATRNLIAFNYENAVTLDSVDCFSLESKKLNNMLNDDSDLLEFNRRCSELSNKILDLKGRFIKGFVH